MSVARAILLLLPALTGFATADPVAQGTSPDRSLRWSVEKAESGVTLRIAERTSRQPPVEVGTFPVPQLSVLVSPGNEMLVVQPATPAPRQDIRLLQRQADGAIAAAETPDPAAALEAAAFVAAGIEGGELARRTVSALHWSADGKSLVLSLDGAGSGITLLSWTAVLEVESGRVTPLPPESFNAAALVHWPADDTPDAVPYARLGFADNRFTLDEKPFTGTTTDHYAAGSLRRRYGIRDGVFDGLVEEWYESGRPKARTSYAAGRHEGDNFYWNPDGTLQVRKIWKDDVLIREERGP